MKEKAIAPKDYSKAFNNVIAKKDYNKEEFQGCLFIYDDEFERSIGGENFSFEDWLG